MNNRRRNEATSMNRTPVYIALVISLFIIICGSSVAYRYVSRVYLPTMTALQDVFATGTSNAQMTANAVASVQAATQSAQAAAQVAVQTAEYDKSLTQTAQVAIFETATALARPTNTPVLEPVCKATVFNTSWMSPQPGWISQLGTAISIPENSTVEVDGRLYDSAWVHVKFNGKSGFMRNDTLAIDAGCTPVTGDLHFLAGWVDSNWRVLVDDSFASIKPIWGVDNSHPIFKNTDNFGETTLQASSNTQEFVFSTDSLRQPPIPAFKLFTYFTGRRLSEGGYFGVRFYGANNSLYEIRFLPRECAYSIYENNVKIYNWPFSKVSCIDRYYVIQLAVDESHKMTLNVNGEINTVPINPLEGGISFVVNNLSLEFNYIVVTAPR